MKGFAKIFAAVFCAELTFGIIRYGLEEIEKRYQKKQERHTRYEECESIYSGKKNHSEPYARKIGFGEQN